MIQNKVNDRWLNHLETTVVQEARGMDLDAYLVALEGWRRGLTLRFHAKDHENFKYMSTWFTDSPGKLYSLMNELDSSENPKVHYFFRTRGDLVTNKAVKIGSNKQKTKQVLQSKDVPVIEGNSFLIKDTVAIKEYITSIGYPVVIKPLDGSYGKDVMLNIQSDEEVDKYLDYFSEAHYEGEIIVEKYYLGEDYRIYVVKDSVVAAIQRVPANVVGDGESTVEQLIEAKNNLRKQNPRLFSCLISVDDELEQYLAKHNRALNEIPNKDERIYLSDKCNISAGGDSIDVLDELSTEAKKVAIDALKAITGLTHGAVDILGTESGAKVLEVNPSAQIGSLVFPMYGQPRDVPKAIIDLYFPETKDYPRSRCYFDLYDVLEPLSTRAVVASKVTQAPIGDFEGCLFKVYGDVFDVGYHRGLRKQAFEHKLQGYIKTIEDGSIEIVVYGARQNIDSFKKYIDQDVERSSVTAVEEQSFDAAVKVGFEIKADLKLQKERLGEIYQEMKQLQKQVRDIEKEINAYHHTVSWQLTRPFRIIGSIYRKVTRNYN
jgi:D-alanine-D-alanine ligase-like ATP-grasp enzyme/acylphosphatase